MTKPNREILKNIYLIMPVRNADVNQHAACKAYCDTLESQGHIVHFPPRDAPQEDPTGARICDVHRAAMERADEVHVLWDVESKGSHFDLGMAYALRKPIIPVGAPVHPVVPGKSYWAAIIAPAHTALSDA